DGHQRPHDERDREHQGPRRLENAAAAHGTERVRYGSRGGGSGLGGGRAHSCSPPGRGVGAKMVTTGVKLGTAARTAAAPRRGCAISKALRIPIVASTCP